MPVSPAPAVVAPPAALDEHTFCGVTMSRAEWSKLLTRTPMSQRRVDNKKILQWMVAVDLKTDAVRATANLMPGIEYLIAAFNVGSVPAQFGWYPHKSPDKRPVFEATCGQNKYFVQPFRVEEPSQWTMRAAVAGIAGVAGVADSAANDEASGGGGGGIRPPPLFVRVLLIGFARHPSPAELGHWFQQLTRPVSRPNSRVVNQRTVAVAPSVAPAVAASRATDSKPARTRCAGIVQLLLAFVVLVLLLSIAHRCGIGAQLVRLLRVKRTVA